MFRIFDGVYSQRNIQLYSKDTQWTRRPLSPSGSGVWVHFGIMQPRLLAEPERTEPAQIFHVWLISQPPGAECICWHRLTTENNLGLLHSLGYKNMKNAKRSPPGRQPSHTMSDATYQCSSNSAGSLAPCRTTIRGNTHVPKCDAHGSSSSWYTRWYRAVFCQSACWQILLWRWKQLSETSPKEREEELRYFPY